jgi:hypothetical protein
LLVMFPDSNSVTKRNVFLHHLLVTKSPGHVGKPTLHPLPFGVTLGPKDANAA